MNRMSSLLSKIGNSIPENAFINGKWVKVNGSFPVYNPYNGSIVAEAADCGADETKRAVEIAQTAFLKWKKTFPKERSKILMKWMDLILENKTALAEIITAENWNFPCAMITRKACAAIAAGCSVVLKPSEETPFSALALAKLAKEAGIPDGVFNVLPASRQRTPEVGNVLCTHPYVGAISFTGSTATGKILLRQSAETVKKVSLELGGSAPFIVFDSADVDNAIQHLMLSKFRNMGQACVASNRIFVQSKIYDEVIDKLAAAVKKELIVGNPSIPETSFGPLINELAVEKVEGQIADAVKHGGKVVAGGKRSHLKGNFFEPTIIANVTPEMDCFKKETFGPLAPITRFDNEADMIALANDCRFGLAGYMFSNDVQQCWRVAEKLEVGMVGINDGFLSLTEGPFGGIKESGLGREGSCYGLDEFMEIKYMCWGVK